jgi:hypothetical protein
MSKGVEEGLGDPNCGAVPGTTNQKTAVPLPATTTIGATTATIKTVFE